MDLFSEALHLVDDDHTATGDAPAALVARAEGSVERLLEAEHRARALERALPDDSRARLLHDVVREAARLAMKTPTDAPPSSALSARLTDATGEPTPHLVDVDQLAADLERLRPPVTR